MSNVIEFKNAAEVSVRKSSNALTATEVRILDLAHLGRAKYIAESLGMAYGTVRTHQKHILLKMGADTWVQAAILWERQRRVAA